MRADVLSLPDTLACSLPEAVEALPRSERASRVRVADENFVLLDRTRGFVRCRLPLLVAHPELAFTYVCWVEVPVDVWEVNRSLWAEPTTRAMIRFRGRLANTLTPFEEDSGAEAGVAVYDHEASTPVIVDTGARGLGPYVKPPGMDIETYLAMQGEILQETFVLGVNSAMQDLWGKPSAYEEFEAKDWRDAPRKQVIAEYAPQGNRAWRYCTLGLSSRPMPAGDRTEFAWEVPRRVTDEAVFRAMARIAAQPWRLKVAFFDGYVLPVQGGFPPGSEFKYALCYDASRAYPELAKLIVMEQRVRVLMPLPIMEREKAAMRRDETKFLRLDDYIR